MNQSKKAHMVLRFFCLAIMCAIVTLTSTVHAANSSLTAGVTKTISKTQKINTSSNNLTAGVSKAVSVTLYTANEHAEKMLHLKAQQEKEEAEALQELAELIEEQKAASIWPKTDDEWDLLYAIVYQEAGDDQLGSYAVISTAVNRLNNKYFTKMFGNTVLSQLCGKGQYTYSIDGLYKKHLGGRYPDIVKKGVQRCVNEGPLHNYVAFRDKSTSHKGEVIGGNVFFMVLGPNEVP